MKPELKQLQRQLEIALSGYLPHKLMGKDLRYNNTCQLMKLSFGGGNHEVAYRPSEEKYERKQPKFIELKDFKPILRPLDLTKEIKHNGEKFIPIQKMYNTGMKLVKAYQDSKYFCLAEGYKREPLIMKVPKDWKVMKGWQLQKLLEWHFNVFNLPEHLWVDMNKLTK